MDNDQLLCTWNKFYARMHEVQKCDLMSPSEGCLQELAAVKRLVDAIPPEQLSLPAVMYMRLEFGCWLDLLTGNHTYRAWLDEKNPTLPTTRPGLAWRRVPQKWEEFEVTVDGVTRDAWRRRELTH